MMAKYDEQGRLIPELAALLPRKAKNPAYEERGLNQSIMADARGTRPKYRGLGLMRKGGLPNTSKSLREAVIGPQEDQEVLRDSPASMTPATVSPARDLGLMPNRRVVGDHPARGVQEAPVRLTDPARHLETVDGPVRRVDDTYSPGQGFVPGAGSAARRSPAEQREFIESMNRTTAMMKDTRQQRLGIGPYRTSPQVTVIHGGQERERALKQYKNELGDILRQSATKQLTAKGTANAIAALKGYYGEALGISPEAAAGEAGASWDT